MVCLVGRAARDGRLLDRTHRGLDGRDWEHSGHNPYITNGRPDHVGVCSEDADEWLSEDCGGQRKGERAESTLARRDGGRPAGLGATPGAQPLTNESRSSRAIGLIYCEG